MLTTILLSSLLFLILNWWLVYISAPKGETISLKELLGLSFLFLVPIMNAIVLFAITIEIVKENKFLDKVVYTKK